MGGADEIYVPPVPDIHRPTITAHWDDLCPGCGRVPLSEFEEADWEEVRAEGFDWDRERGVYFPVTNVGEVMFDLESVGDQVTAAGLLRRSISGNRVDGELSADAVLSFENRSDPDRAVLSVNGSCQRYAEVTAVRLNTSMEFLARALLKGIRKGSVLLSSHFAVDGSAVTGLRLTEWASPSALWRLQPGESIRYTRLPPRVKEEPISPPFTWDEGGGPRAAGDGLAVDSEEGIWALPEDLLLDLVAGRRLLVTYGTTNGASDTRVLGGGWLSAAVLRRLGPGEWLSFSRVTEPQ
jgi:hypothetical protein